MVVYKMGWHKPECLMQGVASVAVCLANVCLLMPDSLEDSTEQAAHKKADLYFTGRQFISIKVHYESCEALNLSALQLAF